MVRTIETYLRKNGFTEVASETDSRRVIDAIGLFKPDLILLDILMPHVSGLELLEHICRTEELDNTICLMLSAAGEDQERRALEIGAHGFIPKPVRREDLLRIIATSFRIADRFGTR